MRVYYTYRSIDGTEMLTWRDGKKGDTYDSIVRRIRYNTRDSVTPVVRILPSNWFLGTDPHPPWAVPFEG